MRQWQRSLLNRQRFAVLNDPVDLFRPEDDGFYFNPHPSNCFQDLAGTIPCAVGDPIARMNDLSGLGHHVTQPTLSQRPILQQAASGEYFFSGNGIQYLFRPVSSPVVPDDFIAAEHFFFAAIPYNIDNDDGFLTSSVDGPIGREIETVFSNARATPPEWLVDLGTGPLSTRYRRNGTPSILIGTGPSVYSTDTVGYTSSPKRLAGISIARDRLIGGATGRIAEMDFYGACVISRVLSDVQRNQLENFFAQKMGILL